jgi:hypothetical protein
MIRITLGLSVAAKADELARSGIIHKPSHFMRDFFIHLEVCTVSFCAPEKNYLAALSSGQLVGYFLRFIIRYGIKNDFRRDVPHKRFYVGIF